MITSWGPGNNATPNCYNRAVGTLIVRLDNLSMQSKMKTFILHASQKSIRRRDCHSRKLPENCPLFYPTPILTVIDHLG